MKTIVDSPGIAMPPPLIYIITFFVSIFLQKLFPLNNAIFYKMAPEITACLLIACSLIFIVSALWLFFKTKNTIVLIKPANTLQISGIYYVSRNPMYLGLLFLYSGLGIFTGNWWTLILIPVLLIVITQFIIKPEEHYLSRKFGESYSSYKLTVRRWL
jgi:protein-S-isoprenylcysteine O-methyltransferase Ste14